MSNVFAALGGGIWSLFFFIIAISVIVTIHELGHYLVGRWSGIKADVCSLGFGKPLIRRKDRHGTIWQIAALPLGGYVRFQGDANAASLGGASVQAARDTMQGAPLWARTATVAAGPIANFLFTAFVLFFVLLTIGRPIEPYTVKSIAPLPFEHEIQVGDQILEIAEQAFSTPNQRRQVIEELPNTKILPYLVMRDGKEVFAQGPHPMTPVVAGVQFQGAASLAGVATGDVILAVDGRDISNFSELQTAVQQSQGTLITLTIWRANDVFDVSLAPKIVELPAEGGGFETHLRIGIEGGGILQPKTETLSVIESLQGSVSGTYNMIALNLSGMWHMLIGNISSCNLSGVVEIAQTTGFMASQGIDDFIYLLAVISAAIGLLNLLPIPVLDGGHLVFFAYEAVTGRPPSDLAIRVLMSLGMSAILTLMVFALMTDIFC